MNTPRNHGRGMNSVWSQESAQTKHAIPKNRVPVLVEAEGFEPTTSCLQSRRSPSELRPQQTFRNMPRTRPGNLSTFGQNLKAPLTQHELVVAHGLLWVRNHRVERAFGETFSSCLESVGGFGGFNGTRSLGRISFRRASLMNRNTSGVCSRVASVSERSFM